MGQGPQQWEQEILAVGDAVISLGTINKTFCYLILSLENENLLIPPYFCLV